MLTQEQSDQLNTAIRRLVTAIINKVGVNAGVAIPKFEDYEKVLAEFKKTIDEQKTEIEQLKTRISNLEASNTV